MTFRTWVGPAVALILTAAGCGSDDFPEKSQIAIAELEVDMRELAADLDMEILDIMSFPARQEYDPPFFGSYAPPRLGEVEVKLEPVGAGASADSGPEDPQDLVDRLAASGFLVVTQTCADGLQRAGFENSEGHGLNVLFSRRSGKVHVTALVDPEHNRVNAANFTFVPDVDGDCWPEPS